MSTLQLSGTNKYLPIPFIPILVDKATLLDSALSANLAILEEAILVSQE